MRIRGWRASRELYRWLAADYRPSSAEEEEAWFTRYETSRRHNQRYAICIAGSGKHVGNAYLLNIGRPAGCAEFHIFIAEPQHRGKGYGSAALHQVLDIAFGTLDLDRVRLSVLADNAPAIALYERTGFKTTQLRSHRKDGVDCSLVDMELERSSYR